MEVPRKDTTCATNHQKARYASAWDSCGQPPPLICDADGAAFAKGSPEGECSMTGSTAERASSFAKVRSRPHDKILWSVTPPGHLRSSLSAHDNRVTMASFCQAKKLQGEEIAIENCDDPSSMSQQSCSTVGFQDVFAQTSDRTLNFKFNVLFAVGMQG